MFASETGSTALLPQVCACIKFFHFSKFPPLVLLFPFVFCPPSPFGIRVFSSLSFSEGRCRACRFKGIPICIPTQAPSLFLLFSSVSDGAFILSRLKAACFSCTTLAETSGRSPSLFSPFEFFFLLLEVDSVSTDFPSVSFSSSKFGEFLQKVLLSKKPTDSAFYPTCPRLTSLNIPCLRASLHIFVDVVLTRGCPWVPLPRS